MVTLTLTCVCVGESSWRRHSHAQSRAGAKFKPLMGGEKEDKAQFMAIVKKVATLVKDSDPKVLVLNESTLEQYGLQPKT